jgi:uncharacterized integral membrane protein (TIGR00698 family)
MTASAPRRGESSITATLAVVLLVGLGGLWAGRLTPSVSAVFAALTIGLLVRNAIAPFSPSPRATNLIATRVLKLAIVCLGAGLDLRIVDSLGLPVLATIVTAVLVGLASASLIGRLVGLDAGAATLIGVGTAICGASAIAAVAPLIRASREQTGVALATIFTFNALALFAYPIVGHALAMSSTAFGTWAGIGVHDTASAVATGFAFDGPSGDVATVVKLTRALFLLPVAIAIAARREHEGSEPFAWLTAVPLFVIGFILTATANSLGLLGAFGDWLGSAAKIAIVFVVGAIGLTLEVRRITSIGGRMFLAGLGSSVVVALVALLSIKSIGLH